MHHSALVKLTSIIICLSEVALLAWCFTQGRLAGGLINLAIFIPIAISSWLTVPRRLTLDAESLTIVRGVRSIVIPLAEIRHVERVEKQMSLLGTSKMGNGGFFGYTGHVYSRRYGHYQIYATELRNLTVIDTSKKRYIISSVDEQMFARLTEQCK